jgi:hypothetical protein
MSGHTNTKKKTKETTTNKNKNNQNRKKGVVLKQKQQTDQNEGRVKTKLFESIFLFEYSVLIELINVQIKPPASIKLC